MPAVMESGSIAGEGAGSEAVEGRKYVTNRVLDKGIRDQTRETGC
jgi:hypothetical protein